MKTLTLIISKCRECPNFIWGECDSGDCLVLLDFVDPDSIDAKCHLKDYIGIGVPNEANL